MPLFPSIFSAFSLFGEYVVRSFLPDGVFFYFVTTGWIFYVSLCENSINQSINQIQKEYESSSNKIKTGMMPRQNLSCSFRRKVPNNTVHDSVSSK